ncbi:uncharacterized protein LOC117581783 [Drosophila guanche]|uniref:uncharacterized protein LOC117581783 n=1 Tax=Drosophila guanche TaxID=7266 RepID=UPI001471B4F8|nr:uncharacterized protein LOC117581783 [Drosophila guanche]
MKLLLLCAVCFYLFAHTENRRNYGRNLACLTHNRYKHESSCSGPRRIFYAFHRIIFNCTKVFTRCPKFHRHNEYPTMKLCQDDCYFHMKIPTSKKPANDSGNATTTEAPADDKKKGKPKSGLEDVGTGEEQDDKTKEQKKDDDAKANENPAALRRANPYLQVGRRGAAKSQKKQSPRVLSNLTQRRRRRSRRYH